MVKITVKWSDVIQAYMCHESCDSNGLIIGASGGWAGRYAVANSKGALLRSTIADSVTLEKVCDNWDQIIDISQPILKKYVNSTTKR